MALRATKHGWAYVINATHRGVDTIVRVGENDAEEVYTAACALVLERVWQQNTVVNQELFRLAFPTFLRRYRARLETVKIQRLVAL